MLTVSISMLVLAILLRIGEVKLSLVLKLCTVSIRKWHRQRLSFGRSRMIILIAESVAMRYN